MRKIDVYAMRNDKGHSLVTRIVIEIALTKNLKLTYNLQIYKNWGD